MVEFRSLLEDSEIQPFIILSLFIQEILFNYPAGSFDKSCAFVVVKILFACHSCTLRSRNIRADIHFRIGFSQLTPDNKIDLIKFWVFFEYL